MFKKLFGLFGSTTAPASAAKTSGPAEAAPIASRPERKRRRGSQESTLLAALPIGVENSIDLGTGQGCGVGESYRQTALRTLDGGRRSRGEDVVFIAELTRELDNSYDSNAIKVATLQGVHLGYLSREDAVEYQLVFKALASSNRRGLCRAQLIGGTATKPSLGVLIDLCEPHSLLARISSQPF